MGTGVSGPSPLGPEGWGGVRLEGAGSVLVGTEMVAEAEVLASTQQFPPTLSPGPSWDEWIQRRERGARRRQRRIWCSGECPARADRTRLGPPAPRMA